LTTPGSPAAKVTIATGVSGTTVVGYYDDNANLAHGFIYDGSTFTTLDHPLGAKGTFPSGVSGNSIVGWYRDATNARHGFLYNGSAFTTLDDPLATGGTSANAIFANNTIVGDYTDSA